MLSSFEFDRLMYLLGGMEAGVGVKNHFRLNDFHIFYRDTGCGPSIYALHYAKYLTFDQFFDRLSNEQKKIIIYNMEIKKFFRD